MAVAQQNEPHEPQINGERLGQPQFSSTFGDNLYSTSKRQRRPSVRLNEIGDKPASSLTKQWKPINNRASKTRPLTNLSGFDENSKGIEKRERERERGKEKGDFRFDDVAIGSWKIKGSKPKREPKRPRLNWVSKEIDDDDDDGDGGNENGFSRDFEMEGCESPLKEQEQEQEQELEKNPVLDDVDDDGHDDDDDDDGDDDHDDGDDDVRELQFSAPHNIRVRHGVDLDGPSDNGDQSGRKLGKDEFGVRVWLNGLGLGRYWPIFEIHEVDEEVLPFLTLEDLKDMGIHAVGSRRKIFCAIQKLNDNNNNSEGFS